ncbi:MAG TPA: hypothetical protein VGH99_06075 [Pseudonocardia sp.]|jgi:hypothetical protein
MAVVIELVAFVVTLAGLLVTLGHAGYLAMLSSAAKRSGLSGGSTLEYVHARRTPAALLVVAALVGMLCTNGGPVLDVLGLVIAGGAGVAGARALGETRRRFRSGG